MSVVQQPPTSGKVILNTNHGELDIELWCKECPKACKNFIQLCLESYYDNTIFHRLIPNFMIQGGDPSGSGEGGESIYGAPFNNELHQRLKFQQRGLVAMASNKPNDNGSQFFITFDACSWLDKKHTIFGKVVGNTIYNLMQINSIDTDGSDKPITPIKIIGTNVVINPFQDIVVRNSVVKQEVPEQPTKPKIKPKQTNLSLLSFQDEDQEEEQQVIPFANSHDMLHDPRLKQEAVINVKDLEAKKTLRDEEDRKRNQLKEKVKQNERIGVEDMEEELMKKRKTNQQIDLNEIVDDQDRHLLKYSTKRTVDGKVQIEWEESDDSSSCSSSGEYETEDQKLQRQQQKEQYDLLKAEVLQFKKSNMGTYSESRNERMVQEKKLLSNVEKQRLKYITNKRNRLHEDEIQNKLQQFREKIHKEDVEQDKNHWVNNKLKFHVDSLNAFSTSEVKNKVQDFVAGERVDKDEKEVIRIKSNVNELIKLSEL